MRPDNDSRGVLVIDPYDASWLPPHLPEDLMRWPMYPRDDGNGFVHALGSRAVEFCTVDDGRAVEIKVYLDGELTHHWRRDPLDGIWPVTYKWQAVEIRGQGLVR